MARHGKRTNQKGRNDGEQYVPLPYSMLKSDAWRGLSGAAVKVYLELHTRFHGANNGEISLSYADAKKLLGIGNATVKRAYAQLQAHGFLVLVKQGYWYGRQAAEWRLTTKSSKGNLPTNEWKQW